MEEEKVRIFAVARHRIGIDGEGVTTLITLSGCPLKCAYCLNKRCMTHNPGDIILTASNVVDICMKDNLYFIATGGGLTIGGGEPLLHPAFLHQLRQQMPKDWMLNVETSLNVPSTHLKWVLDDAAKLIIDIKDMNPAIYERYTQCSIHPLIANLRHIAAHGLQHKCRIRLPLISAYNTAEDRELSKKTLTEMGFNEFDEFEYINPDTRSPF